MGVADNEMVASLRRVFANQGLRRVQLAFLGSLIGDWAYGTAIIVYAYREYGAAGVGGYTAVRFISAAIVGPLGSLVADKVPRKTFMISLDAIRAVLVAVAALCVGAGAPPLLVFALAIVVAAVGAPFRSAQAGLIPRLVDTPDQLTSSNAVAANFENTTSLLGPALAGLLIGISGVETVMWLNVGSFLWSLVMVAGVRVPAADPLAAVGDQALEEPTSWLGEMTAGFRVVGKNADLRTIALLAGSQGFVWGALGVYMVTMAVDYLGSGPEGVGYLTAVMGAATVVGGLVVLGRTTRGTLAGDMVVGVLGWSVPLFVIAAFPGAVPVFLALVVIGLYDPWVNIGFETIPQRLVHDRVLSRAYAAVESALIGSMALGAFLAPVLLHAVGLRWALTGIGVLVTAYAATRLAPMRRLDARLTEPEGLALLRGVSIFAPLTPPVLEQLAGSLVRVPVAAGEVVVAMGDISDRFYVIESGEVEVTQGEAVLRREVAGDFFGEIGLLRDVPRTATVTAVRDTVLLALDREEFLTAATRMSRARLAAEDVVTRRLAV